MSDESVSRKPRSEYLLDGRRVTIGDLLDAGLLDAGDQLWFKRPRVGGTHRAVVTASGALSLEDGQEFRSPSRAATVAAGLTAFDGWHAWTLDSGKSLDALRQQLLDQAAAVAKEDPSDATRDPQKRYGWLKDARALADADKPVEALVRDLLARWDEPVSFPRVEADLTNHGLTTSPNFRKVSLDTMVRLITPSGDAEEGEAPPSPEDDEEELDIGLTVGNLPSALSGIESVPPEASFDEAITVMLLNGYSQLAVISGSRTLRGAVTWQSIAYARHSNPDARFADAIIPAQAVRYDQELIEVLPDLEVRDFVFVRNERNEVAGIITTADVVSTYREVSTPFILIGELDQILRQLISRTFTLDEVTSLCDPEGKRAVSSFDELEMGDYQRTLENPDRWAKLGWPLDRGKFIKHLDDLRVIRNNVMHFNPEPLPANTVPRLRYMLKLLRDFGSR